MKFPRRKHLQEAVELNITAFMNLMVILVPFLLITAVFSRMTVLELNLPTLDEAQENAQEELKLALQLVVRESSFDIQDANLGLIRRIERNPAGEDWKTFSQVLIEIKSRFPDEQNITLLLEPGVNYKTMIEVMDHVRSADVVQLASLETVELFPDISIGDAPAVTVMDPEQSPAQEAQP
ncbi:ExbD/TolR family protein [Cellvibrio sp. ARAG 10.3]|uniref:ExbD/TolR family protein n=1 Tax=Cellvibrio sp. ARAG 10.3 TaxID=3451358 RepID=UPI003F44A5BC